MIFTALGYTFLTILAIGLAALGVYVIGELADRYPATILIMLTMVAFLAILLTWVRVLQGGME